MTRKEFTKDEIDYLKQNYLKIGNTEIGKTLNRNINSIASKIQRLELKRPRELVNQFIHSEKSNKKSSETRKELYKEGKLEKHIGGKGKDNLMFNKECYWKDKIRSKEHCKNISKSKLGTPNPKLSETRLKMFKEGKLKSWNKNLTKETDERIMEYSKKVSKALTGKKYSIEEYPNHGTRSFVVPLEDTKIEVKIQNFLKQLGIEYFTHQYINIKHKYRCDILIPSMNMVIECDGDYWHKYPIGTEIDHIRTSELLSKGFKVLRLWEIEIKKMNLNDFEIILKNQGGKI